MVRSMSAEAAPPARAPSDRRARRRQETIAEILDIAEEVMTSEGVNGLSLSEVARRLGVQPPSLYKYFPSLLAVYDALFERGQRAHGEVLREAMAAGRPGLDSLTRGLEASGRWCVQNRALAQLMFWRPVPSFEASEQAMAPSVEMLALQRRALADAVRAGELGPEADSDDAVLLLGTLISGVFSMSVANEPGVPWGQGRFSRQFPRLMKMLPALYPPS